jgi:hypothetical protein
MGRQADLLYHQQEPVPNPNDRIETAHTASCTGSVLEPALAPSADLVLAASTGAYTGMEITPEPGHMCWASAGCQRWFSKEYQHCFYAGLALLVYRRLPALGPAPRC